MAQLKRIGALWKTRKQGFITGQMEIALGQTIKIAVGQNTKKREGHKDPDFYLYVLPDERVSNGQSTSAPPTDDEIPF